MEPQLRPLTVAVREASAQDFLGVVFLSLLSRRGNVVEMSQMACWKAESLYFNVNASML